MIDLENDEGRAFTAWWNKQEVGHDIGLAYKMTAWNGWIARARHSEAEGEEYEKIGALHRPRSGPVNFLQDAFSIPLAVHGTLDIYIKKSSPDRSEQP